MIPPHQKGQRTILLFKLYNSNKNKFTLCILPQGHTMCILIYFGVFFTNYIINFSSKKFCFCKISGPTLTYISRWYTYFIYSMFVCIFIFWSSFVWLWDLASWFWFWFWAMLDMEFGTLSMHSKYSNSELHFLFSTYIWAQTLAEFHRVTLNSLFSPNRAPPE